MPIHPKLRDVVPKIKWEWNMLCHLEVENRTSKNDAVLDNALLDSFLLHARILYDFFCTPPGHHRDTDGDIDDVSAEQFFDDPSSWRTIAENLFPTVSNLTTELNKHLAHLTYTRLKTKIKWNTTKMFKDFEESWTKFTTALPIDRQEWFKDNNCEIKIPFSTERYEKRLIVFIDLIGFKDYVLSDHGDGKEEAVKAFTSYFQDKVSEGAKYIKGNAHSFTPSFNFFSDTIMFTFPLELFNAPDEFKILISKACPSSELNIDKFQLLFSTLVYIKDIQLHSLQHGLLTRGCVTIGDIYHNKNTWFGPGIIEAYEYESKIAIYPRVILSKSGFEYFKNEVITDKNSSWIQDSDGFFYVNYLAWIHTKLNPDFCEAHHRLREIIVKNIESLRTQKKHKELQKWEWLAVYFNTYTKEKLKAVHGEKLSGNIEI